MKILRPILPVFVLVAVCATGGVWVATKAKPMRAKNGIAKPPMRPALLVAAVSSIGDGRRGECVIAHAVQSAGGAA